MEETKVEKVGMNGKPFFGESNVQALKNEQPPVEEIPAAEPIAELPDVRDIKKMNRDGLRRMAKAAGVPSSGTVAELKDKLTAKRLGGDRQFLPRKSLCPSCGGRAVVNHTETGKYRRMKCIACSYRWKDSFRQ